MRRAWQGGGTSRSDADPDAGVETGPTQLNLLGPLEILVSGVTVSPGGAKPQILFAYLCLHANRHVSVDNIIEAVWGEAPPSSAKKNIQLYVSRLRRQFAYATGVRLITTSDGYQLTAESDQVDLERCQQLWQLGQESLHNGATKEAGRLLREAIRLWRGKPLSGLTHTLVMQAEAARLEQFRLGLLMKYFQAQLADGQHFEIIPELLATVADHPHQERLRADLMMALWRSGQRHAALATYREAYQLLADDLGIFPGRQLHALHQAILADDADIMDGLTTDRSVAP
ncbi:BTAD domain-containing putative transcriptional regulator [Streptomyces sp. NPDC058086]|uniref:AfsR/SARP family transcriptional regulator n=1 Tax=Streptomyces sp. NPDC058086 TaxID=3346334 RepID=UPI0036E9E8AB